MRGARRGTLGRPAGGLPPFQAFFEEHRRDVWRFLVATLGAAEAEDCFQETFLSALRAYGRLEHDRNLRAWILTIAHHRAIDTHRRRARSPVPVGSGPDGASAPSEDGEPELWAAVRDLPPKQRAAVVHRFVGDLAYKDIAAMMSCSEAAARQSVHEGVKRLREVLER